MKPVTTFKKTVIPALALFICGPIAIVSAPCSYAAETVQVESVIAPGDGGANLMRQGRLQFRNGDFSGALSSFESASARYADSGDRNGSCEALIMAGQAANFSGQYRKALESGDRALSIARELGDKRWSATALGTIGNSYLGMGDRDKAGKSLNDGLSLAREGSFDAAAAAILNNIGNLRVSMRNYQDAMVAYGESAALAEKAADSSLAASAAVNAATAAVRGGRGADASTMVTKAIGLLTKTEDSAARAYGLINAGLACNDLRRLLPEQAQPLLKQAYDAFSEAAATAERTGDLRSASYAYGYLGQVYEDDGQLPAALELTRRAIFAAQQKGTAEALYRWHWQGGRILAKMQQTDEAIASYRHSLRNLQSVREEMSSCYASPESSYQKSASVVSVELVDLLLQRASKTGAGESPQSFLVEARDTLEGLKVFELREYFKDDCIDAARVVEKRLDTVSANTVVFYPILLKDRVELLVNIGGTLKRSTIPVGIEEFTREVREFRHKLVKRTTWEFLPHAQKLYNWLIRPLEADLAAMKVDTIVFVPDGALRTVPMAALHDGNQFLINRYPIAITPSMTLADPKPVRREGAKLLSLGITDAVQGFPGLPYVSDELSTIKSLYSGEQLLNAQFRLSNLEKELKREPFSIVHIASHGQFGGNIDTTFLLAFDEKLTMDRFSEYVGLFKFREEPLDLLTLSACETAAGDDRAALGLAGVAVRAGARSALATLWHVNDPASFELIAEFYSQLRKGGISRAAALQTAQLKLIGDQRYDHPGYWAPFLLINNWL